MQPSTRTKSKYVVVGVGMQLSTRTQRTLSIEGQETSRNITQVNPPEPVQPENMGGNVTDGLPDDVLHGLLDDDGDPKHHMELFQSTKQHQSVSQLFITSTILWFMDLLNSLRFSFVASTRTMAMVTRMATIMRMVSSLSVLQFLSCKKLLQLKQSEKSTLR